MSSGDQTHVVGFARQALLTEFSSRPGFPTYLFFLGLISFLDCLTKGSQFCKTKPSPRSCLWVRIAVGMLLFSPLGHKLVFGSIKINITIDQVSLILRSNRSKNLNSRGIEMITQGEMQTPGLPVETHRL